MTDTSTYKDAELVSLREAAAILGVSVATIARYRECGKFPFFRYSKRKILYRVGDLRSFKDDSYISARAYLE